MKAILAWNDEYLTLGVDLIIPEADDAMIAFEKHVLARSCELLNITLDEAREIVASDKDESICLNMGNACIRFGDCEERLTLADIPVNQFCVNTQAGQILATRNTDPGAPGVSVTMIPKGFDTEIDLTYVEVKENPEYVSDDKETAEDVCVYTYADPFDDDYTSKSVVRRADVQKALCIDEIVSEQRMRAAKSADLAM